MVAENKNKQAMSTINASQLQQILDLNSKSIEIYLEVNNQYESIIKQLEDIKEKNDPHCTSTTDSIKKMDEKLTAVTTKVDENQETVREGLAKIEKSMSKQEIIISTSLITIILSILSKLLFGV